MKILFIVMRFGKDGLATNILELTRGMVQRGHELHIITSGFKYAKTTDPAFFEELKSEFSSLGVHMHYFKEPKGATLKKIMTTASSFIRVIRLVHRIHADVIHCHSPNMTFVPWLLGKKFVSTVHAETITPNFRYKHPNLLIAVSKGSKAFTMRVMHSPEKSIRMVYHGIDERFAQKENSTALLALKENDGIPKDKIIIGAVGRVIAIKGQDILANAIGTYLSPKLKDKIHIVLVGDYESKGSQNWFNNILKKNTLENQVTVLSFRDPKPYYQMFDVFVLPSRSETFGLVAVEAMMGGCCTIRSNTNGAYDQINHGTNGLIFETGNERLLAQQLEKVLLDTNYRKLLGIEAQKTALAKFTKTHMVNNTLEVYKELL